MKSDNGRHTGGGAKSFTTTHWSVVLAARRDSAGKPEDAIASFCQSYWQPLYAFVRLQGYGPEDAEDLTQGFFAHLLGRDGLAGVDPGNGRFRSFLLACLRHYLANERDRARAQKRGGGRSPLPLDGGADEARYTRELVDARDPVRAFERSWALNLLERVLGRLRREQVVAGKQALFERLLPSLVNDPDAPAYASLATQTGLSEEALRMTVSRLRQRFRRLLREEIMPTVSSPAEVEEELRHLLVALA